MDDLISRQAAISHVDDVPYIKDHPNVGLLWKAWIESLPSAQPEKVCIAKITLPEEQVREAVEKAKSEIVQALPSVQLSLEAIVHPQILDDAERRYLSAVIRPFRNRVEYIKKIDGACEEYIYIQLNRDWTILPRFKEGTMYKGMEPGHKYTLEELGLL